ncbi:radical SAM protein [Hujiaoplasma nucleasis]|uniref:Radical SAM protein n=1 Tax=Hujiaoplasma nucleasis TaxID=2725268 RepID=A0A7L6N417_9MOLU|nr:radical SAM protein [Hujiaoplasma nucleasis]QLY39958.1 radical SAM protein [Hujiaoplasma nucleasis]
MHYKKYKHILQANGRLNLTRGCIHACIYCDSRSDCYQMNHDFTDIEIKEDAAMMLDQELSRKKKKIMIKTGAMSDPFMDLEPVLKQTRACFEVISKHGFPLSFQTKSDLFLKDLDLLKKIHKTSRLVVQMTITCMDDDLSLKIEPNVTSTSARFEAIKILRDLNIPVILWISPLLPYINDDLDNLKAILNRSKELGVKGVIWYGAGLTLRRGNREYFYQQLDRLYPGLKKKYIEEFGFRYHVMSKNNEELTNYLHNFCEKFGIMYKEDEIWDYINYFDNRNPNQLSLF